MMALKTLSRLQFLALAGLLLGPLVGCGYNPDLSNTCYVCGDNGTCPDGSQCIAGLCMGQTACKMACGNTLSNAEAANFSVGFGVMTRSSTQSTLLYQRAGCDAQADFWNILLAPTGQMTLEIGRPYASLTSTATVNDGQWHQVYARRFKEVLTLYVDNLPVGSMPAAQKLGMLPPLGLEKGHPCEASGLKPLLGTVAGVCLWVRP